MKTHGKDTKVEIMRKKKMLVIVKVRWKVILIKLKRRMIWMKSRIRILIQRKLRKRKKIKKKRIKRGKNYLIGRRIKCIQKIRFKSFLIIFD